MKSQKLKSLISEKILRNRTKTFLCPKGPSLASSKNVDRIEDSYRPKKDFQ